MLRIDRQWPPQRYEQWPRTTLDGDYTVAERHPATVLSGPYKVDPQPRFDPFRTSHWSHPAPRPKAVSSRNLVVRRLSHGHGFRTRGLAGAGEASADEAGAGGAVADADPGGLLHAVIHDRSFRLWR